MTSVTGHVTLHTVRINNPSGVNFILCLVNIYLRLCKCGDGPECPASGVWSKEHANQQSPSPPSTQQHANCLLVQAAAQRGAGTLEQYRLLIVLYPQQECISTTTSKCLKSMVEDVWSQINLHQRHHYHCSLYFTQVILSDDQKTEAAGTKSSLITDHDES